MKITFHSGHFADTASASDDSATPVRNFTPSFSTSFCAFRTAVAGSPPVSSKTNSTGRPRIPLALMSFANSSAARLAWMPYWALLPDSAAGMPILIGPWAHERGGMVSMLAPTAPVADSLRKSRLFMTGPPWMGADYSHCMPGPETFHEILARRAAAHPDREAIVDHRHRVTYGELLARVDRTAAGLQHLGIGPGDVVTIQLPNWVEFAYVFFACERIGAVANQIGPDFRSREVEYIVRFSESRAFVCPATFKGFDYVDMMRQLRPGLTDVKAVIVLGGGGEGTVSLDEIIYGATEPPPLAPHHMDADEIMRMAFTSGTTGNPKGVTHSFNTTLPAGRILNTAMNVTEREVFLVYLPVGLNWGYLTLVQSVMAGARVVLLDRF